jgi:hypothetical protein
MTVDLKRSPWRDKIVSAPVLVILGGLLLATIVLTAIALGHDKETVSFEGSGTGWCMYARAGINAELARDATRVDSYTQPCDGFKVKDPHHLRTKVSLLKKHSDGVYHQCTFYGSWGYNRTRTYATTTLEQWGGGADHPPCRPGLYRARGRQGIYANGDWKRGKVTSRAHYWGP